MSEIEQRLLMLIDDEPAQCRLISALAAREGWRTLAALFRSDFDKVIVHR